MNLEVLELHDDSNSLGWHLNAPDDEDNIRILQQESNKTVTPRIMPNHLEMATLCNPHPSLWIQNVSPPVDSLCQK